ncbi:hypothetical protein VitviT2T_019148 [Vitis vinifera]|uniref:Membrane-associated kinase regulator 4 n=2 Tax=Vitis vinifera TaxID=29760 RepID=A0ABY9CZW4_VITVI|nr:probable membrane-associated kinase regulator 4 [Vitis vinifera]WKA00828.1 hypothetical protein VitviT2T_019148 [Vitis vinifera]|eukprot:XP_002275988.2 PREDICTED: probable membrane-associated kinase regulator 4 [Vitis vinifera]
MVFPSSPLHRAQLPISYSRERVCEREISEMAIDFHLCDDADEDYIDMEVSSYSNFLCHSISSPPHPREFEFHMSSSSLEREITTSPADELFYKGKLLPLHLPPRLQMVETLLQNSNSAFHDNTDTFRDFYSTPLTTTATTPTTTSTPFESCNISPSESCRVSGELNPDEYFLEYSTDMSSFISDNPKKSWMKKFKLIKQSSFGLKLKASRAYLKSLFGKPGCSDESCVAPARTVDEASGSKSKESLSKYMKAKKNPFGLQKDSYQMSTSDTRSSNKEKINEDGGHHRRSFSGAFKRHLITKSSSSLSSSGSSSSSSSSNANGSHEFQFLKRSSSANSEFECSIQGAIAHCKQSQQLFRSRKTVSEVGFCTLSASRIAVCDDQERPVLCRG